MLSRNERMFQYQPVNNLYLDFEKKDLNFEGEVRNRDIDAHLSLRNIQWQLLPEHSRSHFSFGLVLWKGKRVENEPNLNRQNVAVADDEQSPHLTLNSDVEESGVEILLKRIVFCMKAAENR